MAQRTKNTVTFAPAKVIQPIYTRGNVALSRDGRVLASCLDEDVVLTDLQTGEELARIEGDGEIATTISITPSASHLIICSRSLSMRIYTLSISDSEDATEAELLRTLKPHTAPVVVSAVDQTGTLIATGGADGVVKIWDIRGGYVTHTFHGHSGVISALYFFEIDAADAKDEETSKKRKRKSRGEDTNVGMNGEGTAQYRLASGGEDGNVRIWNLHKRAPIANLDAHASVVRTLHYSPEENVLLSGSRDKTVSIWDVRTWKTRNTVAILEEVESAGFLQQGSLFYTGGETARLRVWSSQSGEELTEEQDEGTETEAIQDIIHYSDWPYLLTVHADQTLMLHSTKSLDDLDADATSIPPLPTRRRICGTHGQIIDVAYVGQEKSLLALATNSEDIRIISLKISETSIEDDEEIEGGNYFGSDIALLKGHEDIVIAMDIDWSGHWLATGAKDNTSRLWRLDSSTNTFESYATFTGHAQSVGAVGLPKTIPPEDSPAYTDPLSHPPAFLITGSQDQTIKKWDVRKSNVDGKAAKSAYTRKAHEKDINALAVHHSSQFFASASQDRTVKIWSVEDGSTIGILKGHKRGVWSVAFSAPGTNLSIAGAAGSSRGYALTGSGDKMVKIWSLVDYSCLMTMEGHTNSVLKVLWLPPSAGVVAAVDEDGDEDVDGHIHTAKDGKGPLVASAGADGLVKVWEAQSGECATTLDNHTDRVWALTCRSPSKTLPGAGADETLISGAGDGVLTFWTDTTATTALESRARESRQVELQQNLDNFVHGKNWREAIALALQLDQPGKLLHLFKTVVEGDAVDKDAWTGNKEVDAVIAGLADEQILKLLMRVRDWNTNARNFLVGQRVLRAIVEAFGVERLAGLHVRGQRGRSGVKEVLEGLRVYGERHFQRVSEMWDESFLVEFTLGEMDEVLGSDEGLVVARQVNGGSSHDAADYMMLEA